MCVIPALVDPCPVGLCQNLIVQRIDRPRLRRVRAFGYWWDVWWKAADKMRLQIVTARLRIHLFVRVHGGVAFSGSVERSMYWGKTNMGVHKPRDEAWETPVEDTLSTWTFRYG